MMPYKDPDDRRALFEIAATIVPFATAWVAAWALWPVHPLLALLAVFPAAGLMVRLFIIQHDCGHGSMFTSRLANDWVGRAIGVLTLTPYDYWRHSHALHHASSGNLDKRGFGDIDTLTVDEYMALSRSGRLRYRLYRHPLVMFGIGPAYLFIFRHRLPVGAMDKGPVPWVSTLATNAGIAAIYGLLIYAIGLKAFLLVQVPIVVIGASIGVWLFYVQHQFEHAHWERTEEWQRDNAALHGSSFYDLPKPLMWLTGNIGIHHVHHLSSRIPFHRLPQILKDYPELKEIGRLTFWQSLKCVPLTLWDEQSKRLISFREARRRMPAAV
ncbi:fatty acid desaturase [Rhizobiaceae bacterium n13]|uniref:Fatty acid desaturase n=2 Tax=Ferirhizobium litorale TaxID=2927786 RepID=A0AAE3U379_9HYPH|nr:fatty acid desaturase [Fererhizobium litorale]MDI7863592.1 fatty acid desaturase [Fererhizobium litorale]MDI7923487.1 fatty acid desaturase [Fererhizobium litorale]